MIKRNIAFRTMYVVTIMILVAACGSYMRQPLQTRRAILGPESPAKRNLLNLPAPQEKIVTAVYKFRDQTGQYKASETGASWSTAVTQGATTILIRALEESGWFIPIERENLANLLNERKVIRSSRAQYEGTDPKNENLLPPLLFAGVILEGGIISYETNILTGGAGIRYFGTDLSGQFREDRVSIYIRAVSTANGKVLKTVYTTKTILSQEVSIGVFRYVKPKRLLEAETGFTYNEPTEICVTEAIEKAVESLIIEGVKDNLWGLKDQKDTTSLAFTNYEKEKKIMNEADIFGLRQYKDNRGKLSLGVNLGSNYYSGDLLGAKVTPNLSFQLGISLNDYFKLETDVGYSDLYIPTLSNNNSFIGNMALKYVIAPYHKLSPFISAGGGFDYYKLGLSNHNYYSKLNGNVGLEYLFKRNIGLSLSGGANYYLNDHIDGEINGDYNDFSWGLNLGLKVYLIKSKQKK